MTKHPRISIRVSQELKDACDRAGAKRVREVLKVLLSDNPAPPRWKTFTPNAQK